MIKELIICIIIIISIFVGNNITQGYTEDTIEELNYNLSELKKELENENQEGMYQKLDIVNKDWDGIKDKLAYYIEHDELEKVETNLVSMKSFIETEEYDESINELDKGIFVLKHIEDKNGFSLRNIF